MRRGACSPKNVAKKETPTAAREEPGQLEACNQHPGGWRESDRGEDKNGGLLRGGSIMRPGNKTDCKASGCEDQAPSAQAHVWNVRRCALCDKSATALVGNGLRMLELK